MFLIRVPYYFGEPQKGSQFRELAMWVVVRIMVPFWVLNIVRHLLFRVPKRGTIILTTTNVKLNKEPSSSSCTFGAHEGKRYCGGP